ncbi:MAG: hydrogenase maturation protease [Chloroflexota bacterium]|nr:hydrogenase maturation protease [Chloroflexota bacterium]
MTSTSFRVIGIGNPWASDDGIGPVVVEKLRTHLLEQRPDLQTRVQLFTLSQPGLQLLEFIEGCQAVVIIDAVSSGSPPGTIHQIEWQPDVAISRHVERASTHGFGVAEVLALAQSLDRLPERIRLWGIEARTTAPGQALSPKVAAAIPACIEQIIEFLEQDTNSID